MVAQNPISCQLLFRLLLVVFCLSVPYSQSTAQQSEEFQVWLSNLKQEAISRGYSDKSIELAFSEIRAPVTRIVTNDRNQAEVVESYADYLGKRVSEWKQENGVRLMQEHNVVL